MSKHPPGVTGALNLIGKALDHVNFKEITNPDGSVISIRQQFQQLEAANQIVGTYWNTGRDLTVKEKESGDNNSRQCNAVDSPPGDSSRLPG